MRKRGVAVRVAFQILICALVGFLIIESPAASAQTFYVGGSGLGNFSRISDAVSQALDGDTVFVYNGTYFDHITIHKRINLTGEDRNSTIIDGKGVDDVVRITANWVNVSGFTVKNCGNDANDAGVEVHKGQNCSIFNNNFFSHNMCGIYIWDTINNNIFDNNVSYNKRFGIYLDSSVGINITNNTMVDDGIHILGEKVEAWNTHNIDNSNTVSGRPVYYWKDRSEGTIPIGSGEIILANCSNVIITNQVLTNSTVGIELGMCSNNRITCNNISNNFYGIYLV